MSEADAFLNALRFMTVLPLPEDAHGDADWLARASKYFPAAGMVVGVISALTFALASHFWTGLLPATLAVGASVLLTGALHEDGLVDTADGLGGGTSRETRLAIMKDSRIGTFGALALGLTLLLRIGSLATMSSAAAAVALLGAHALARTAATVAMNRLPYAGDQSATRISYSETVLDGRGIATAMLIGFAALIPALLRSRSAVIAGLVLAALAAALVARRARRLIGGHTGDVLGAIEQVAEAGFLLGAAASH